MMAQDILGADDVLGDKRDNKRALDHDKTRVKSV